MANEASLQLNKSEPFLVTHWYLLDIWPKTYFPYKSQIRTNIRTHQKKIRAGELFKQLTGTDIDLKVIIFLSECLVLIGVGFYHFQTSSFLFRRTTHFVTISSALLGRHTFTFLEVAFTTDEFSFCIIHAHAILFFSS